ncbi:MAG: site-2 protease family protein [Candidatus Aenigmatarchaeota archaeon]
MPTIDVIAFFAFVAAIAALVWRDRRNVKVAGIVLMRRTQRGKGWLYRTAARAPRAWNVLATLGVITAVPAMVLIAHFLLGNALQVAAGAPAGEVKLALPWSEFEDRPIVLLVPWYFWVIGIAAVIVPHELFHGIACRVAGIKIKSLGWMLLIFLPGAFVEPDKRQLERASRIAKLRVYAAGSFANFVVAALCLLAMIALLEGLYDQRGIIPASVVPGSPAYVANISGVLLSIDGIPINSEKDLVAALRDTPIGGSIAIHTTAGNYTVTTVKHPELNQSYLGVKGPYVASYALKPGVEASGFGLAADFMKELFGWLYAISFGIGLFNLLPIKPLDGGLIFEEMVSKFLRKRRARLVTTWLSLVMTAILVFNIIGPALIAR